VKKTAAFILSCVLLCAAIPFGGLFASVQAQPVPESLKILCLGNSFALDTMEHIADIADSLGVKTMKLGTLYIGGCSINKHYTNAVNNNASYEYYVNTGDGWTSSYNHAIRATIESEDWDWISIQHGTADGSRYAEEASYTNLPNLIGYIRQYASADTRIAFNMTWVGEPGSHEELIAYGNDQLAYYKDIAALTRDLIVPMDGIDRVSPTGTAVQNARTAQLGILTRDNYHLSLNLGRYIAGLTFFKALTGADISGITWTPPNTTDYMKQAAIEAANNAIATPFAVTASTIPAPTFEWPDFITYGKAATPEEPFFAHAAKTAPIVTSKVDLLPAFQYSAAHPPVIDEMMQTSNGLGKSIDLSETPYLYYSFAVPSGSDFTFAIYSNSNYSPWFSYLDAAKGNAVLSTTVEEWNAAQSTRSQYAKTSQTGCIDMRQYAIGDTLQWIISQMRFYAPKGDSVIVSYFFFGSEEVTAALEDGESLLPTRADQLTQVDGQADATVNADGSLTVARGADSAVAWPSVRYACKRAIDLAATPYLHLNMTVTNKGCGNGFLNLSLADGTTKKLRLSELVNGTATDFTADTDVYIDLAKALGRTDVVVLDNYSLSVYGVVGASVTWKQLAFVSQPPSADGDVNGDGEVTTADARVVLLYTVGSQTLTEAQKAAADVNGDGDVSTLDARDILMAVLES